MNVFIVSTPNEKERGIIIRILFLLLLYINLSINDDIHNLILRDKA